MAHKIEDLFKLFSELSGLSDECVRKELEGHLERLNIDRLNITENDLRRVMSLYLEEMNCSMIEDSYAPKSDVKINA
ncbi:hypothetical protein GW915_08600 [bacterium]|nr:hypothetical protein [bacterium]